MAAPKSKPAPAIQDESLKALADAAQAGFPETWIPEKNGDIIAGTFVRLDSGMTSFGMSPIVVIRTEDGQERSVWLLHEALRSQLNRIRPNTGDKLAILYLGKTEVKTKTQGRASEYHNYRVTSDKATEESSWDSLLGSATIQTTTEDDVPVSDDDIPF